MKSPHEKPEKLENIIRIIENKFVISEIKPWVLWSMYYAVICVQMKSWVLLSGREEVWESFSLPFLLLQLSSEDG